MSTNQKPWYNVGVPGSTTLHCCACRKEIDLGFPSLDHHSSYCPTCGIETIFFSWKDVLVQIIPEEAPLELTRSIRWAQENLDELEVVTVLSSLTQVFDAVRAGTEVMQGE